MSHIHTSIQASVREVKPESFRVEIVSLHVQCLCVLLCPSLSTCYENRLIQHVNNHTKIISMHAAIYMWEDSLFFEPIQHKYFFYFSRYIEKTHEHENFETKDKAAGQVVTRSTLIYVRFVHDDVYSFPITRQTHERMRLEILTFFVSLLDCFLKVLHMMI